MTREDQIKKATEIIAYGCSDELKAALIQDFPELAESEDEKIREALIWHLKAGEDFVSNGVTKEECIAYLEKQKDAFENGRQLGIMQEQARQELEWPDEKQKDRMTAEEFESSELFQLKLKTKYANGYQDGLAQKDQKREWSEEDERVYQELIYFFTHDTTEWFPKRRVSVASVVKFLKSLRPSWKPSEREKGALRTAIHILTDERSFPKAAAQLQNILDAFE